MLLKESMKRDKNKNMLISVHSARDLTFLPKEWMKRNSREIIPDYSNDTEHTK